MSRAEFDKFTGMEKTLDRFSLFGVTMAIFFDTRRAKRDNRFPVKYRVTYMGKQVYYSSGIDMTAEEWERLPHTKKADLKKQREFIHAGYAKVKGHIEDLFNHGDGFTIEALNRRLSRGTKDSLVSAFEAKEKENRRAGKIGTAEWYKYALNNVKAFKGAEIKFSEVTPKFLAAYEKYLLDEGKSYTSISMYMRALRAIINEGKRENIISPAQYPFGEGKYEIPAGEGRKMALTLSQIGDILNYPLITTTEKRCRDLWFFSYLCNGINMVDLLNLKHRDVSAGKIYYYRAKTVGRTKNKKKIVAILLPEMEAIIDRWGNPDKDPDNYVFPFLDDTMTPEARRRTVKNVTSLTNKKMRFIGQKMGLGNISTYTARHSYATVLKRSGANIAFISESLGHTDVRTTENYLDSFEDDTRLKNAQSLIPKGNGQA